MELSQLFGAHPCWTLWLVSGLSSGRGVRNLSERVTPGQMFLIVLCVFLEHPVQKFSVTAVVGSIFHRLCMAQHYLFILFLKPFFPRLWLFFHLSLWIQRVVYSSRFPTLFSSLERRRYPNFVHYYLMLFLLDLLNWARVKQAFLGWLNRDTLSLVLFASFWWNVKPYHFGTCSVWIGGELIPRQFYVDLPCTVSIDRLLNLHDKFRSIGDVVLHNVSQIIDFLLLPRQPVDARFF